MKSVLLQYVGIQNYKIVNQGDLPDQQQSILLFSYRYKDV